MHQKGRHQATPICRWNDCLHRNSLLKMIYRFNTISNKIPARFSLDIYNYSKMYVEWQRKWNSETILEKSNQVGENSLFNFKTYIATEREYRPPERDPHKYAQLNFDKCTKAI